MKAKSILLILIGMAFIVVLKAQDEAAMHKRYTQKTGNLRFKNIGLAFSGITINDIQADTIFIYNDWDNTMTIHFNNLPEYITCEAFPPEMPPKTEGKIAVTYNAPLKGEYGRIVNYFFFETNDVERSKKKILVSPIIKEDFSSLSEEERKSAPVIRFEEVTYDFGSVNQGDTVIHLYPFRNEGYRTLFIRATRATCGCTKAKSMDQEIEPGESSMIKVIYTSRGKKGEQKYHINVTSNDPKNPDSKLEISGNVLIN